jgi:hypothetical protein
MVGGASVELWSGIGVVGYQRITDAVVQVAEFAEGLCEPEVGLRETQRRGLRELGVGAAILRIHECTAAIRQILLGSGQIVVSAYRVHGALLAAVQPLEIDGL